MVNNSQFSWFTSVAVMLVTYLRRCRHLVTIGHQYLAPYWLTPRLGVAPPIVAWRQHRRRCARFFSSKQFLAFRHSHHGHLRHYYFGARAHINLGIAARPWRIWSSFSTIWFVLLAYSLCCSIRHCMLHLHVRRAIGSLARSLAWVNCACHWWSQARIRHLCHHHQLICAFSIAVILRYQCAGRHHAAGRCSALPGNTAPISIDNTYHHLTTPLRLAGAPELVGEPVAYPPSSILLISYTMAIVPSWGIQAGWGHASIPRARPF